MTDLNAHHPASILEMGGTAHTRAMLAKAEPDGYFCRLHDEAVGFTNEAAPWQGPFEATAPEVAAAMWVRQEWDCRHNEEVHVLVRAQSGGRCVVRLQTKVKIIHLTLYPGPPLSAA